MIKRQETRNKRQAVRDKKRIRSDRYFPCFLSLVTCLLFLVSCTLSLVPFSYATFSDEVGVTFEEAFTAAKQVVESDMGIKSLKPEDYKIVSNWKTDMVTRRRGILRHFIKKEYRRRYRLAITITKGEAATQINAKVYSQEKSRNVSPSAPWKDVRGDRTELKIERETFNAILKQLSRNKSQNPIPEVRF